ncbi:MAG: murein transglycosylase [Flavobacteriales bacterium]|nr:murein transglycosylase [Flavobacteriales bacterium]
MKFGKALNWIILPLAVVGLLQIFFQGIDTDKEEQAHKDRIKESYNIYSLSPPENFEFAGSKVPMEDPEVYERFDRELHSNTYFHSNTILYFKRANRWFPVIEPILQKNGIPDDFKYLALVESGLQNVVSPVGAAGYWQFMEETAKEYGLEVDDEVDERYHMEKSTEAACKYLNDAYSKYGDWALVAASYNVGKNRIDNELERQKTDNYFDLLLNQETSRYLFRIMAVKQIFAAPEDYGFHIRKTDLYSPYSYDLVKIDSSVENWADFSRDHQISYKTLKRFNPWLRQVYLKNSSNKEYQVKIPTSGDYKLN